MVCIFEAWHTNQVASRTKCSKAVSVIIPTESVVGNSWGSFTLNKGREQIKPCKEPLTGSVTGVDETDDFSATIDYLL